MGQYSQLTFWGSRCNFVLQCLPCSMHFPSNVTIWNLKPDLPHYLIVLTVRSMPWSCAASSFCALRKD